MYCAATPKVIRAAIYWIVLTLCVTNFVNGLKVKQALETPKGDKYNVQIYNDIDENVLIFQKLFSISDHNSNLYACHLKTAETTNEDAPNLSPESIIESLRNECIQLFDGWWSYELCLGKQIRQYHSHDNKVMQEYFLGHWTAPESLTLNDVKVNKRVSGFTVAHVSEQYSNGTMCDLSEERRGTEVRYICSKEYDSLKFINIEEIHTCKYQATVAVPSLCRIPTFQIKEVPTKEIICIPTNTSRPSITALSRKKYLKQFEMSKGDALQPVNAYRNKYANTDEIQGNVDETLLQLTQKLYWQLDQEVLAQA